MQDVGSVTGRISPRPPGSLTGAAVLTYAATGQHFDCLCCNLFLAVWQVKKVGPVCASVRGFLRRV